MIFKDLEPDLYLITFLPSLGTSKLQKSLYSQSSKGFYNVVFVLTECKHPSHQKSPLLLDDIPFISLDNVFIGLFTPLSSTLGSAKKCHLPLSSVIFNKVT